MEKFKVLSQEEIDKMLCHEADDYFEELFEYIESLISSNPCQLEICSILSSLPQFTAEIVWQLGRECKYVLEIVNNFSMSCLMILLEYASASMHQGGDDNTTLDCINIIKSIIEDRVRGYITLEIPTLKDGVKGDTKLICHLH